MSAFNIIIILIYSSFCWAETDIQIIQNSSQKIFFHNLEMNNLITELKIETSNFNKICHGELKLQALVSCLTQSAKISQNIKNIDHKNKAQVEFIGNIPNELSGVKSESIKANKKREILIEQVSNAIIEKRYELSRLHQKIMRDSFEENKYKGKMAGFVNFQCESFEANLDLIKSSLELLTANNANYFDFFKLSEKVNQRILIGQNLKSICEDKINLEKAKLINQKIKLNLTIQNFEKFKKIKCSGLKFEIFDCEKKPPTSQFIHTLGGVK